MNKLQTKQQTIEFRNSRRSFFFSQEEYSCIEAAYKNQKNNNLAFPLS